MPVVTYLYIGTTGRDFPGDPDNPNPARHTSFTVEPGDTVEAETNPDAQWFDPTGAVAEGQPINPETEGE